jgi:HEAT repeat protein
MAQSGRLKKLLAVALLGLAASSAPAIAQKAAGKGAVKKQVAPAAPPAVANVDVATARVELFGADPDKAVAAATKLGQVKAAGALDALLDALALGLHPKVAAAALEAVGNHKSPQSIDVLTYYSKNRNPELRARATTALGKLDDKRARAAAYAAFTDGDKSVRAAACKAAEDNKDRSTAEPLIALLQKGDEAAVTALAAIANPDIARKLGELVGQAPDDLLARTLGLILLRPDFGTEQAYAEVVVSIGKVPGDEAVVQLTNFISATPEKPPRLSRRRAQEILDQRLGGGN